MAETRDPVETRGRGDEASGDDAIADSALRAMRTVEECAQELHALSRCAAIW